LNNPHFTTQICKVELDSKPKFQVYIQDKIDSVRNPRIAFQSNNNIDRKDKDTQEKILSLYWFETGQNNIFHTDSKAKSNITWITFIGGPW